MTATHHVRMIYYLKADRTHTGANETTSQALLDRPCT